jgi:hypothetical protein
MLVQDTDIFNDLQLDQELHEVLHHMMRSLERIQPIKLVDDGVEDLDINHEMFYETKLFRLLDPEFDQDKINYDQNTRHLLKMLGKRIKHYENRLTVSNRIKETSK